MTLSFKEILDLSHFSLKRPTELCHPLLFPQLRDEADQLVSCHSCLGLKMFSSASDFHWDSGQ